MATQYETVEVDGKKLLRCVECGALGGEHKSTCDFIRRLAISQECEEQYPGDAVESYPGKAFES